MAGSDRRRCGQQPDLGAALDSIGQAGIYNTLALGSINKGDCTGATADATLANSP